jgi:hypothetical protein
MDYSKQRGKVGTYKGIDVVVLTRKEYDDGNLSSNVLYVISDWGMRMILNGDVIGTLSTSGTVTSTPIVPYRKKKEEERKEEEESEFEIGIPDGYFEQYSSRVDEFFKAIGRV